MKNEIQIVEQDLKNTLEIKANIPMWKMPVMISKAYKKIVEHLEKSNIEPSDPPYIHYLNINWDEVKEEGRFLSFIKMFNRKWEMLIGFPVKENREGSGEISAGILPKGKYVQSMHYGPYQKVGETYKEMISWIKQNNLDIMNESVEIYLNDPRNTKKKDLQTIVLIPIAE